MVEILVKELAGYGLGNSELANSIEYKIKDEIITIDMNEYGIYLDEGTKPHTPPISSLNEWADSHGINVWALQASIKENGTKAKPFLNALEDYDFSDIISDTYLLVEVEDDVDNIFKKYFKNIKIN